MRTPPRAPKVIDWLPFAMLKDCTTCSAAFQSPLPAWSASMVHTPACTSVTVVPETVQTVGVVDVNDTPSPEPAVAPNADGVWSRRRSDGVPKEIVWLPL